MKTIFNKRGCSPAPALQPVAGLGVIDILSTHTPLRARAALTLFIGVLVWGLSGCSAQATSTPPPEPVLRVVATTNLVGDVVSQVGGELVAVDVLLPYGSDPHSYQPTPRDIAKVADARALFINDAGLEAFLEPLLQNAGESVPVVQVSEGITLLEPADGSGEAADHPEQGGDPHVWTDPNNVLVWVTNIERALSSLNPQHAASYAANASAYREQLRQLDRWIQEQVNQVPPENRILVSDHWMLGYFAQRYGFLQAGALVPSFSTLAEPSAQELAALQDEIRDLGVKAIFVSETVNPQMARLLSEDSGIQMLQIYSGSLTPPDGPAGNYIAYMQHNVQVIVDGLK
ncbi:MAG: metal ABC transporter substrate-binding protein [Anaerolineales bacterium]|nr:metal ABC transporter substrate-binding protein [Anaerolineales bacterium]